MNRRTINITAAERVGRILIGIGGVIGGLILLGSGGSAVISVLEVLLVLAGLDLIVTGALGHCPLYRKLGHIPPSLKDGYERHAGHGHWLMIACCVPMLVIAIALVAAGVVGAGFIVVAVMCTAMMAMMMKAMSGQ